MKFSTKKMMVITAASLVFVSYLSGCCEKIEGNTNNHETTTESCDVIESSIISESSISTQDSEVSESEYTGFTYETITHTSPFSGIDMTSDDYTFLGRTAMSGDNGMGFKYGFDNPYSLEVLRNYVYEQTGVYNEDITLSDVNYFYQMDASIYDWQNFSSCFSQYDLYPAYSIEMLRAVLQTEGLRFGIDEIPYSFFERRFPQFINERFNGAPESDWENLSTPLPAEICGISLELPTTYGYDFDLYATCLAYNQARYSYIYGNSASTNIIQVRDELTGRNILVPTDSQYEQLMADINSLPNCENIDPYQVETPEEFYASYGCYPEDLLNEDYMYAPNKTAIVEQNSSGPSRQI